MIWFQSANSHMGPGAIPASEAGQRQQQTTLPVFFKNRLHLAGRPRMSRRPNLTGQRAACRCHSADTPCFDNLDPV